MKDLPLLVLELADIDPEDEWELEEMETPEEPVHLVSMGLVVDAMLKSGMDLWVGIRFLTTLEQMMADPDVTEMVNMVEDFD